ncbi:hypothetical protein FRC02_008216 [Tulasnella sp. 418]|nr:hypothetical protein FRC02_008216 [Tulasnella sp. 418]
MDLAEFEPFQSTEKSIPLSSNKHGDRERSEFACFQPEFIMENTSAFSTARRATVHIGSVPFGAGLGVVHGIGSVGKKAKGLFGRRKTLNEENGIEALGLPPGKVSAPVGSSDGPNALPVQRLRTPPRFRLSWRIRPIARSCSFCQGFVPNGRKLGEAILGAQGWKELFKTKHAGKTLSPPWYVTLPYACNTSNARMVLRDETLSVRVGLDAKTLAQPSTRQDSWRS